MWKLKNNKFRFQRFWRRPKHPGVVGGWKFLRKQIGNAIKLQWPIDCCQATQKEQLSKEAGSYAGILNSLALLRERNVRLTILSCLRISFAGQTLIFGSYVGIICGKPDYNNGTYWSCQAHKLGSAHLPNLTKLGSIVHSHRLHRLICSYWWFSIVNGKTHCALNHSTYSICHTKRPKEETRLELHT